MENNTGRENRQDGYTYDVIIKGYDTSYIKATTGTPTVSSNKLRLNATSIATYILHRFADLEIGLNVPTTPSSGEAKTWGFRTPATDQGGAAYFEITGATFRAVTKGDDGTSKTTTLTWSAYEGVETKFRIKWTASQVIFMINGAVVATHSADATNPTATLPIRVTNADSDNCDIGYFLVREAAAIV